MMDMYHYSEWGLLEIESDLTCLHFHYICTGMSNRLG